MTLKKSAFAKALARIRSATAKWFDAENDKLVRGLIESGAAAGALRAGDRIPDFLLPNAEGMLVKRGDLFGRRPVVLSFYRGMWCPYCSAELDALAAAAPRLRAAGADIVAVTPEVGGVALRTKRERKLDFEILCDVDNGLAMECGLVFRIPSEIQPAYLKVKRNLPLIYGNDSWMLPIPATYVVGADGAIVYAYINPDYRERLDPEDLVDVLVKLGPRT